MVFQRKLSKGIKRKLDFLLESQYWPYEKLRHYQWEKLQELLQHAYSNVPHYKNAFQSVNLKPQDITSPEIFKRIPIFEKRDIQADLASFISVRQNREALTPNSTGGSTGQPLNFYHDNNYLDWEKAAAIRAWKYMVGQKYGDLEAVVWGAERDIGKGLHLKRVLRSLLRDRKLSLNTFDLDEALIKQFLIYYNALKPKILRGYSSSLFYLARFIDTRKIKIHYPRCVISSAEMLWQSMRDTIERVFNARVYDSYGCREVSQVATECEKHDGLHVVMENQYVEIEESAILVTNLNNYGMPFIRYRIGDMADELVREDCSCGRKSERVRGLRGRESDMIPLPNGKTIHGEYFTHLFYGIFGVSMFEVLFHEKSGVLVVKCNDLGEVEQRSLRTRIYDDFGLEKVVFEGLGRPDKMSSGKFKFISVVAD